jgi:D-glycero-alpha-D-manno-heptose 1-phosphate guanylyltransferase
MRKANSQTCIILAGGLGTRLRSVVSNLPKCLAPINGIPFLSLQIEQLVHIGVDNIVLSLGYLSEQVIDYLKTRKFPVPVSYVVEQEPLGTGGAIAHALDSLELDEVLVANGDTYLDGDMYSMLRPLTRPSRELFRMATVQVPDRSRYGGLVIDNEGKILSFLEKGQSGPGPINAGLYRLCRDSFSFNNPGKLSIENDVLPMLVKTANVTSCPINGDFIDIGNPDDYQKFIGKQSKRKSDNHIIVP